MTTLGTPLTPYSTKVMLLGAGELGKEVLIALQRLGVETIAVDRYDHAPGQQVAHHARTIAMSDPAQLKALIEAEKPHLVVPEIEAIATPMLEELEAAGTVRVIPTARAILGLPVDTSLRNPGASAVIYGGVEAAGIVFDGVDEALRVPGTDLRLFGKPESFARRRMGVVLARADGVDTARAHAKQAAGKVRPRTP